MLKSLTGVVFLLHYISISRKIDKLVLKSILLSNKINVTSTVFSKEGKRLI